MGWLDSLIRGLSLRPSRDEYLVLTAAQTSEAIDAAFAETLGIAGFEHIDAKRWVRNRLPGMRDVVGFELKKGATYQPYWGVSLDFVPLVRNCLSWKRTAKSAYPDLRLEFGPPTSVYEHLEVPTILHADLDEALSRTRQAATATGQLAINDLSKISSLEDVADTFARLIAKRYRGLGPMNYTQTPIAYGLVLIALGNVEEGESQIASYFSVKGLEPAFDAAHPMLIKARELATKDTRP